MARTGQRPGGDALLHRFARELCDGACLGCGTTGSPRALAHVKDQAAIIQEMRDRGVPESRIIKQHPLYGQLFHQLSNGYWLCAPCDVRMNAELVGGGDFPKVLRRAWRKAMRRAARNGQLLRVLFNGCVKEAELDRDPERPSVRRFAPFTISRYDMATCLSFLQSQAGAEVIPAGPFIYRPIDGDETSRWGRPHMHVNLATTMISSCEREHDDCAGSLDLWGWEGVDPRWRFRAYRPRAEVSI